METFFYIVRSLLALVAVIWLANVGLRYLNRFSNQTTKSIQIVERISVSKASSLAIVKIVNDYYLMSFSENSSETLQKFSPEEAKEIEARLEKQETIEVSEAFQKFDLKAAKDKFAHYFENK